MLCRRTCLCSQVCLRPVLCATVGLTLECDTDLRTGGCKTGIDCFNVLWTRVCGRPDSLVFAALSCGQWQ